MPTEARMAVGGAVILPDVCAATSRQRLREILDARNWGNLMPEPVTPKEALRAAMVRSFPAPPAKCGIKHRCDPHKNGSAGYKIGAHRPADAIHVGDKYTTAIATGTLRMQREEPEEPEEGKKARKPKEVWTGEINLDPYDGDKEQEILAYMKHVMEYVPSGKLLKVIAAIVGKFGGRRLIVAKKVARKAHNGRSVRTTTGMTATTTTRMATMMMPATAAAPPRGAAARASPCGGSPQTRSTSSNRSRARSSRRPPRRTRMASPCHRTRSTSCPLWRTRPWPAP